MRNGHPYSYVDLERDRDVQELLYSFSTKSLLCQTGRFSKLLRVVRTH